MPVVSFLNSMINIVKLFYNCQGSAGHMLCLQVIRQNPRVVPSSSQMSISCAVVLLTEQVEVREWSKHSQPDLRGDTSITCLSGISCHTMQQIAPGGQFNPLLTLHAHGATCLWYRYPCCPTGWPFSRLLLEGMPCEAKSRACLQVCRR